MELNIYENLSFNSVNNFRRGTCLFKIDAGVLLELKCESAASYLEEKIPVPFFW